MVGVEVLPCIFYGFGTVEDFDINTGTFEKNETSSVSYGFSTNPVKVTLAYRF